MSHDCVVVPGLGALINVRHAARYDSERRVWIPMTREVRFNAALSHDDGLLAGSYARKNCVSFNEGREMLRRDIDQLRDALESDGEITIGSLGVLRLTDEAISFVPQQTSAQMADILGYMPALTYVPEQGHTPAIEKKIESTTKVPTELEETSCEEGSQVKKLKKRVFDTDKNYYIAINKIFARTAAIFLLIAVVSLSLLPSQEKPHVDEASVVPAEKIIKNTAARLQPRETNKATDNDTERPDTVSEETEKEGRYHIVVATFRSPSEADEFIRQNEGTGYALRTVNTKTMSRVSAISSDDKSELQSRMMSPEFRMRFGEAWIWEDRTR